MKNSIRISIDVVPEKAKEEIIGLLSRLDVDGFEEAENKLLVYFTEGRIDEKELEKILKPFFVTYSRSVISPRNWNEEWESSFSPVIIDNFCCIRADFHPPVASTTYEIIITPKMSFGTGHHETTFMIIQQMKDIDFESKKVADFGTGTGVLAILSEKLGSESIWAVDVDDWSIANAYENIERNGCSHITIEKADSFCSTEKFEIILANINKNVILANLNGLVFGLKQDGRLLLSGLLQEDEKEILEAAEAYNLVHQKTVIREKWISLLFSN